MKRMACLLLSFVIFSCREDELPELTEPIEDEIRLLPIVVHVLHHGEAVGEGTNLSEARILRQVEILMRISEGERGHEDIVIIRVEEMRKLNLP